MDEEACHLTISLCVEVDVQVLESIGVYADYIRACSCNKFVVGLTGDIHDLGNWNPEKGVLCTLAKTASDGIETWCCRFTCPFKHVFQYRFFVAELKENNDEYTDTKSLRILAWESRINPRTFSILDYINSSDKRSLTTVRFGSFDKEFHIQRGWLTSNSELHVRVSGSACKFFNWPASRSDMQPLYISCFKYIVQTSCGDDCEIDTATCESSDFTPRQCSDYSVNCPADPKSQLLFVRSFSAQKSGQNQPVLLSALDSDRCRMHRGENDQCWGTIYKPGDDITFYVETNDIENTAVVVNFYRATSKSPDMVFIGSARFGPFESTYGRKASQILNPHQIPIGDLRVQYLIVHPMARAPTPSLAITYQHHWKKRKPFEIGHRGMGTSFIEKSERSTKKPSTKKENTLDSFREAVNHGADFVEMDVQLTKDHHVIVYHDYEAVVISKKKRGGRLSYLPIAIKDLNLEDLRELKVHHSSVLHEEHTHEIMDEDDLDPIESQSFPLLRSCFEEIDPELGFVIEVKYPMDLKEGKSEMPNFFEYNFYVDTILREILTYAGKRRILLSCFDPNVCAMLQLKQNLYPVFQLGIFPEYADTRQSGFERLFWSAISQQLLGVCLESDRLLEQPDVLKVAHTHGLVVLAWGEAVNCREKRLQLSNLGVDGMIYDRLYEHKEKGSLNIFKQKAFVSCSPEAPIATETRPAASRPGDLHCASPAIAFHEPKHVAVVKECVPLEKLSHTNSTTTCESMPGSESEAQPGENPTREHPETVDVNDAEKDGSSAQHVMPLVTLA